MIVGSTDTENDLLNSRYVSLKVYGMNQTYLPYPLDDLELRYCTKADLDLFNKERVQMHYLNSLCFNKKSNVKMHANWHTNDYRIYVIMADACQNTTENGNWCATPEEIDRYTETTIFYLIR